MREKYFCPNCRAVITCGERFCGNCGTALRWVIPQSFEDDSPSDNPQNTAGRQLQKAGRPADADTFNRRGKASSVGTMTSLSNDIARLLAGFEKQIKDQPN
jgi:hypothetical protein